MQKESENCEKVASMGVTHPDAHGQAALFLVESLIHGLIARSALSVAEALEIVQIAADASQEVCEHQEAIARQSLRLLNGIGASLSHDLPEG